MKTLLIITCLLTFGISTQAYTIECQINDKVYAPQGVKILIKQARKEGPAELQDGLDGGTASLALECKQI